jgi:hypothetical protein
MGKICPQLEEMWWLERAIAELMRYESVNIANSNDAVAPLFTVQTRFIEAAP